MARVRISRTIVFATQPLILTWEKEKNQFSIVTEKNDGYNEIASATSSHLAVVAADPRLSVSVIEDAKYGLFRSGAAIIIKNVGGSEAQRIRLNEIAIGSHKVTFPANIPVLNAGDSTQPIFGKVHDYGTLQQHDIAGAMLDAWNDHRDISLEHMSFPAFSAYTDYQGHSFKASWTYEFLPYKCQIRRLHRGKEGVTGHPYDPYLTVSAIKTERLP